MSSQVENFDRPSASVNSDSTVNSKLFEGGYLVAHAPQETHPKPEHQHPQPEPKNIVNDNASANSTASSSANQRLDANLSSNASSNQKVDANQKLDANQRLEANPSASGGNVNFNPSSLYENKSITLIPPSVIPANGGESVSVRNGLYVPDINYSSSHSDGSSAYLAVPGLFGVGFTDTNGGPTEKGEKRTGLILESAFVDATAKASMDHRLTPNVSGKVQADLERIRSDMKQTE
ncbi:hypothetical protein BH10CYA1_BH10CYA1_62390 [soil metagenome]